MTEAATKRVLAALASMQSQLDHISKKLGPGTVGTVELGDMPKQVATTLGLVGAQSTRLDGLAIGVKAGLDALLVMSKMIDDGNTAILGKLEDVRKQEEADMSALSDAIAAVDGSVDAARDRVVNDVAGLKAEIVRLQGIVDSGGATQADLDALAALKTKVDQIDPATASTI